MFNKINLYINTIKYLKASQLYYRLVNRLKRKLYKINIIEVHTPIYIEVRTDSDFLIPELDFSQEYLCRFDAKEILSNKFTFINIKNKVDLSKAWNDKDLQQLWRYNLHYFDYIFKLAYEYNIGSHQKQCYNGFKQLVENWIDNNPFTYGDGWHPYTISLRISNWILVYQVFQNEIKADLSFDNKIKESIHLQYGYLQNNLEKDVLGNHYFANIKAIIILSIFFNDIATKEKFKKKLLKQLDEQILEDGMHFELSPMYHKIILEDLIKITYWLKDDSIYNELCSYLQKMIDVTYSLEQNFGKTPAFNDSADGISKDYRSLIKVCKKYFDLNPQFKGNLEHSGFYIIKNNNATIIFDTGDICPDYLPAHGHCDALSFELSINNTPMIVNSGTYKYEKGEWRDYFRSTKSHNTVMISNQEQSQFWSSFRVAKRIKHVAKKQFLYKGIQFFAGRYTSCHGNTHKRFIGNIGENIIVILDSVKIEVKADIKSYLHFLPESYLVKKENIAHIISGKEAIKITAIGTSKIEIEQGWYSGQFNIKKENKVLIFNKDEYKNFFGYVIALGSNNYGVTESENTLKIVSDLEVVINYDELGAML